MSTSIILLDQNFNANDIIVFEPSVLFPTTPSPAPQFGGGIDDMVQKLILKTWHFCRLAFA